MRIAFYLRSRTVHCRYGAYFLGSALSLRAALPRLRDRYDEMSSAIGRSDPRRRWVPVREGDHA